MGIIKCGIYIAVIGVASFIIGRLIPNAWLKEDQFPFKSFRWERSGAVYHALGIRKWHKKVPDMSKLFPQIMKEKKLNHDFQKDLPLMIKETCIAEFIHVMLCFAGLYCLRLWPGIGGQIFTALYILSNIPFILIQRYNRPRLTELQNRLACKHS